MSVTLYAGDCLQELGRVADGSVDACVTDPPYELAFMGRAWDRTGIANSVALWREVYRVLKPGGHLLAFGGTRTYHRMVCAIEDAGFEIRDTLQWLYGAGFPKSLDVSKAIDKAAGAARAKVVRTRADGKGTGQATSTFSAGHADVMYDTAPATDLAAQWAGWGTALKPAHEPIVLARKPLVGTVAANVLAWGTGAINVDACRVGIAADDPQFRTALNTNDIPFSHAPGAYQAVDARKQQNNAHPASPRHNAAGRRPPNVLLTHHPDCVCEGTRQVAPTRWGKGNQRHGKDGTSLFGIPAVETTGYEAPDGTETVPAWRCVPGCPVAVLDEQSGERESRPGKTKATGTTTWFGDGDNPYDSTARYPGDTGGASRFYPTFAYEAADFAPFLYCGKASRRERNAGCEGLTERQELIGAAGHKINPMTGRAVVDVPRANHHPTVKPQALLRWLATLVTPPGGLILDPFLGSGSMGVAALSLGYRFIGIEKDTDYLAIAQARITAAATRARQLPLEVA